MWGFSSAAQHLSLSFSCLLTAASHTNSQAVGDLEKEQQSSVTDEGRRPSVSLSPLSAQSAICVSVSVCVEADFPVLCDGCRSVSARPTTRSTARSGQTFMSSVSAAVMVEDVGASRALLQCSAVGCAVYLDVRDGGQQLRADAEADGRRQRAVRHRRGELHQRNHLVLITAAIPIHSQPPIYWTPLHLALQPLLTSCTGLRHRLCGGEWAEGDVGFADYSELLQAVVVLGVLDASDEGEQLIAQTVQEGVGEGRRTAPAVVG